MGSEVNHDSLSH